MNSAKIPTSDRYQDYLLETLRRNPQLAADYIIATLEEPDCSPQLLENVLLQVAEAFAKQPQITPAKIHGQVKQLYALSDRPSPQIANDLFQWLDTLGLKLTVSIPQNPVKTMQQTDRLIFSAFLLALSECDRDRETQLSPPLKAIAPLLPENPSKATEKLLTLLHANDTKFLYNAYNSYYNALHALYQANPQKSHIFDDLEPTPENIPKKETLPPLENFDLSPSSWEKTKQVYYIQDEPEKPTFLTRIKNIFNASQPIAESQKELDRPNNPQ